MTQPYVGQLQLFGFNYAPVGWALCQGQLLPIAQNAALYSILGTNFGGNGQTTFGLPNLQGIAAVGAGQGTGLSGYAVGQIEGATSVTVTSSTMPMHNHNLMASSATGTSVNVAGNQLGVCQVGGGKQGPTYAAQIYSSNPGSATTGLAAKALAITGGGLPHNNMQPYLTLSWVIALQGIFPSRS
jgi:microcystin-dependent protein